MVLGFRLKRAAWASMASIMDDVFMPTVLDNRLTYVKRSFLDNRPIECSKPWAYVRAMSESNFRARALAAMAAQGVSKAELARRSGVPYHALDKFLKGATIKTSAENALAIGNALGISLDGEAEYQELRRLFFQLEEEQRRFLVASVQGLLSAKP